MGRMNLLSGGIGELPTKEFLCGGEFSDGGGVEFGVGGGGSGVGEQRGLQVRKRRKASRSCVFTPLRQARRGAEARKAIVGIEVFGLPQWRVVFGLP
jgi:hypothetical protein